MAVLTKRRLFSPRSAADRPSEQGATAGRRRLASVRAAALVAVLAGSVAVGGAASAAADRTEVPAPDGSVWTDVDGNAIKAHGGSVVEVEESVVDIDITGDGTMDQSVYLWYGEDKSNATRPVDGVRGYWSTDLLNWNDMGLVLPSHQFFTLRVGAGGAVEVDPARVTALKELANRTEPGAGATQAQIDEARAFVAPYVEQWADEEAGVAATYDEENLANATYRLNGNINIMERPKMLYNELTGKFVIIYHADGPLATDASLATWVRGGGQRANQDVGSRYSRAEVGFATADSPFGPFKLVNTTKMNYADGVPPAGREGDSRDMTVFQDTGERTVDPAVDDAYVVYSSEMNKWMYISRLNAEYTGPLAEGNAAVLGEDFSNRVLPDFSREASSVLKYDGYYYMLTSGTDGWASTPVVAYRSRSMITDTEAVVGDNNRHPSTGQWERLEIANPCVGAATRGDVGNADPWKCFDSQPTFAIALDQEAGQFIYMGDRWITESNGSAGERSRYVWAPIQVHTDSRQVTVENVGSWSPTNSTLFSPVVPTEPLVFRAAPEDRESFDPTFDATVGDESFSDVRVAWTTASLDAAFATGGSHEIEGHIIGEGANAPLDQRYVTATVVLEGPVNVCAEPGTTVSATFHQTAYSVMPPSLACDGNEATAWSTWASGSAHPSEATITYDFASPFVIGEVAFRNIEGSPSGVRVEHRHPETGAWAPTSAGTVALAPNGSVTTVAFDEVTASGLRLVLSTPSTYLKITEITIPGEAPVATPAISVSADTRCVAGRVVEATRVTNTSAEPVEVALSSAHGTRTLVLAPERSASVAFSTRLRAVPDGQVSATVTSAGAAGSSAVTGEYVARSCA